MQDEIDQLDPVLQVEILGINKMGEESGNAMICEGRHLPWLQETSDHPCWDAWHVTWRDVVICDRENVRSATYNLTTYNLAVPANYDSLKRLILDIAGR